MCPHSNIMLVFRVGSLFYQINRNAFYDYDWLQVDFSFCLICMSIVTITEWNKDGVELNVQLNIIFGFLTFS